MQKIPLIYRVSEDISTEVRNGKAAKVITFLASDDKHYMFRLEKKALTSQNILGTQCVEMINCSLPYHRESFIRRLNIKEASKTFIAEDLTLVPISNYTLTLQDILDNFMSRTSFGTEYP